jgi:folate-binding protein YgfZ
VIIYTGDTMLAETYRRDNVPLVDLFGVEYPAYFVNPIVEYQAIVRHAGIIDLTHWRTFRLSGRDRVSFLNAMVTNDIATLEPDQGSHALITTIRGKIIAELFVFASKEDTLVLVPQGNASEAYDIIQKHIITEDVSVKDLSSQYGVIALEGPSAEDVLWRIFPTGPFPKGSLHAVEREFEDAGVFLMKNSVTGEDGYHMMIPAKHILRLRGFLVQAAHGSDGLPVGAVAWNMRRVEKGLPWFGIDFTENNLPDETRLGSAISYTKGCFRGHETLSRLHHRGQVNRVLVGLTVRDNDVPEAVKKLAAEFGVDTDNYDEQGLRQEAQPIAQALDLRRSFGSKTELYSSESPDESGKSIGWVTSVAFSPELKKPLIFGYIRRETASAKDDVFLGKETRLIPVDLPLP